MENMQIGQYNGKNYVNGKEQNIKRGLPKQFIL